MFVFFNPLLYVYVCVGREGETEYTLLNHMHPVNLPRTGQLPSLPPPTKTQSYMTPPFQTLFIQITPQKNVSHPLSFTGTNKNSYYRVSMLT